MDNACESFAPHLQTNSPLGVTYLLIGIPIDLPHSVHEPS